MGLKGIIVNGDIYKLDYSALDNLPEPVVLPEHTANDKGKSLVVDEDGEWALGKVMPVPRAIDADSFLSVDLDGNWILRSLGSTIEVSPLPSVGIDDEGKVLAVNYDGDWVPDDSYITLRETVASLTSQLNRLKERVDALASGSSDTQAAVMNDKITLNSSGAIITGEKLSVTGSDFTVNGEKLSIA